jgi:transposase-like protein
MTEPSDDSASPFVPPFCPAPDCKFHLNSEGWRFKKDGFHLRKFDRQEIQRYKCTDPACGRSFSTQTFSITYWLKRPDLLHPVFDALICCSGYRQLARVRNVSPNTIAGQAARLGRHLLLFHEVHRPSDCPEEELSADGFESFAWSQYYPTHLITVSGAVSHFVYGASVAELRRKGRMTQEQKERRDELEARYGRPDPKANEKAMADVLAWVVPPGSQNVRLETDKHKAYPRALKGLSDRHFLHQTTSSKAPRTTSNALFPANLLHLLMRHGGANHKRETIAFSKRQQSMVWRDAVHRCWRNYCMDVSQSKPQGSPAMRLGLMERLLTWPDLAAKRLFVTRMKLPEGLEGYYWGRIKTRQIENCREHELIYAF